MAMSRLNAAQVSHTYSHQVSPIFAMSQSTRKTRGIPTNAESTASLARSVTNKLRLVRLKPKRASITKVRYKAKGRSTKPEISATEAISAMPSLFVTDRSEEHTSELQSLRHLVC